MHWLGLDYKEAQDKEFGSRNKHNDKGLGVDAYIKPIKENAEAVKKVLKKRGYYCIIVGDAILKGKLIKMNAVFDDIFLNLGYQKARELSFEQRKYTRTFTKNTKTVYKDSYILIYQN
jgi:site-specific DNA-methyltransferase (cytosine-N4-specific)